MLKLIKEGYKFVAARKRQLSGLAAHPALFKKLFDVRKHIYSDVGMLTAKCAVTPEPIPFSERLALDLKPISEGQRWGGKLFDCSWFNFKGKVPDDISNESLYLLLNIGAEGCVFDENGAPVKGLCGSMSFSDFMCSVKGKVLYKLPDDKKALDIWVEGGNNGFMGRGKAKAKLEKARIVLRNEGLFKLYYDYLTLHLLMITVDQKTQRYRDVLNGLKKANSLLNTYSDEEVEKAQAVLTPLLDEKSEEDFTFYAVGHSHLDLAWLWPIRETKRKAGRTFSNQLYLTDTHSDYIYGASQPQQFEWTKKIYPGLYERMKKAVDDGNFEPQGGMWVEADTNITGGESLVRQMVYGKRFFNDEFGKDMKILWLPDVFGFSGALPQIIKKSGMDYFLTIKLFWNEHNKFPHNSFIWEGIDGTGVIVHMPPEGNYNSEGNAYAIMDAYNGYPEKFTKCGLITYGVGDGGGGPGETHYELISREKDLKGLPKIKMSSAIDFFEILAQHEKNLPTVQGELYLEKHQGTLTSQAKTKLYNRKIEYALRDTELLAAYASQKGYDYPQAKLEEIWKEVLLYQFHDIIPGSSIKRVYDESIPRYQAMLAEIDELKAEICAFLSSGKKGFTLINTLPFARKEYLKHDDKWLYCEAEAFAPVAPIEVKDEFEELRFGKDFIENEKLKLSFNADGTINEFLDKSSATNFAGKFLNKLTVYKDIPLYYDAWDIDIKYQKRAKKYFELVSFENIVDGAEVIRRNHYKFNKSTLVQDIVLTSKRDYAEFRTEVDWQETHKMLRADFRPSIFSDKAVCNIQWGNIERSTRNDTKIERAQYEVCAHKFAYVKDGDANFAVLNDCKYGYKIKEGLISLNLLRSTTYPDECADKGIQNFTYAIYAGKNKDFATAVVENAYCLNVPLIKTDEQIRFDSLISSNRANIIVETVKKAEYSNDIVLRAYESIGKKTKAQIKTNFTYTAAFESDMLENNAVKVDISALEFTPYEIKTIILKEKE